MPLSNRQMEYIALAWQCFEAEPKIDYKKFKDAAGLSSEHSARELMRVTKRKLREEYGALSEGVQNANSGKGKGTPQTPTTTTVTPRKRAAPGTGTGRKSTAATKNGTPAAAADRDEGEDDEENESPSKKSRKSKSATPKVKCEGGDELDGDDVFT